MEKGQAEKLKDLQILEQNLQSILLQKQTYQLEISDINNALEELGKHKDEVYKMVGSLMIKAKKEEIEKELRQKKDINELRMKNTDQQEQALKEKLFKIRNDLMDELRSGEKSQKKQDSKIK
jgi:prefoldin beta subunit